MPKGYKVHFVSSGSGIPPEATVKLNALVDELKGPSSNIVSWDEQPLHRLQEQFYQQTLPAVKDLIKFEIPAAPYMLRSGVADCYLFHVKGDVLAGLYETYGEGLLQRNIRVDQHETPTNRSIEGTCTGDEAKNFLHFNNGVTFLCEKASFDHFQKVLTLEKAQVVNGGQTIRVLFRAYKKGSLSLYFPKPSCRHEFEQAVSEHRAERHAHGLSVAGGSSWPCCSCHLGRAQSLREIGPLPRSRPAIPWRVALQ